MNRSSFLRSQYAAEFAAAPILPKLLAQEVGPIENLEVLKQAYKDLSDRDNEGSIDND